MDFGAPPKTVFWSKTGFGWGGFPRPEMGPQPINNGFGNGFWIPGFPRPEMGPLPITGLETGFGFRGFPGPKWVPSLPEMGSSSFGSRVRMSCTL
jgi:hypothetical protein